MDIDWSEVEPNRRFSIEVPADVDIDEIRRQVWERAGLTMCVFIKVGPVSYDRGIADIPWKHVDAGPCPRFFRPEVPAPGNVTYIGYFKDVEVQVNR